MNRLPKLAGHRCPSGCGSGCLHRREAGQSGTLVHKWRAGGYDPVLTGRPTPPAAYRAAAPPRRGPFSTQKRQQPRQFFDVIHMAIGKTEDCGVWFMPFQPEFSSVRFILVLRLIHLNTHWEDGKKRTLWRTRRQNRVCDVIQFFGYFGRKRTGTRFQVGMSSKACFSCSTSGLQISLGRMPNIRFPGLFRPVRQRSR